MKNKKWISLAAAVVLAVTALPMGVFAAKKDSTEEKLTKVTLNEVAHSIFYAPQYVAIEEGYFKDEGLDLTLVTGFGADKTMTAVISGNLFIRRHAFAGKGAGDYGSRETDCRQGDWRAGRKSLPGSIYFCSIYSVLYHDEFHVKYSNDSHDGSHLCFHSTGNGGRSQSGSDGVCDRRVLCICNTDWHAGQYDGSRSRQL